MDHRLLSIVKKIRDRKLQRKVRELLDHPNIKIAGTTFSGLPLESSPASIRHHHNYPGGFIEHTIALAEFSMSLAKVVERVYGCKVDRDLILAGILLHDIYKPLTYTSSSTGMYKHSDLAERVDHLSLVVAELIRRDFPLGVIHTVSASHGWEHGPIGPMTLEAFICHLADYIDAKLNGEVLRAARSIIREITGEEPKTLNGKDAFTIITIKATRGLKGVQKYLSDITPK